jgi:hypothetical protein
VGTWATAAFLPDQQVDVWLVQAHDLVLGLAVVIEVLALAGSALLLVRAVRDRLPTPIEQT